MASLIPANLPVIMERVEEQLLTFNSPATGDTIVANVSNIYWVLDGNEPPPGTTGQRDILLVERKDDTEGTVIGGGRIGAWIASGLDINLRSSLASDRRGSNKMWIKTHRNLVDAMMDSLMGFFPVDGSDNALTIEGFVLDENASPVKNRDTKTWGETVATYRFHYLPNINRKVLG